MTQEINVMKQRCPKDFNGEAIAEWKVFRKYLFIQKQSQQCINFVKNRMMRDIYPQRSLAVEIFLYAPISTITVERDFNTTNRY